MIVRISSPRLLLPLLLSTPGFTCSFVSPRPPTVRSLADNNTSRHVLFSSARSFLKQKPGESDIDFFKRIQKAASDPVAFEKMALGKAEDPAAAKPVESNEANNPKKTNGYVRAEEWDAQVKATQQKGEFTWEEKVKFDGQRMGNGFNQNEILRKNLKGF